MSTESALGSFADRRVALLHTSFITTHSVVEDLCRELLPGAEVLNLVDDSLVTEVFAKGKVDANITRRVCLQVMAAESAGAEVILGVCNSVTEAVETASRLASVPVVLIDEPMAEKLVREASRVGVVGTSWLSAPSLARLIKRKAAEAGREVAVTQRVSREAFEAIRVGDFVTHDRLVVAEVRRLAPEVDAIALSQGSMARVLPLLADLDRPIFTSPRLAVERVREVLAAGV